MIFQNKISSIDSEINQLLAQVEAKPNQATHLLSDDEKRAIAAKVTENAKLMKYCLQQAREHCSEYLETSEDLRAVATTLFLQAVKR